MHFMPLDIMWLIGKTVNWAKPEKVNSGRHARDPIAAR